MPSTSVRTSTPSMLWMLSRSRKAVAGGDAGFLVADRSDAAVEKRRRGRLAEVVAHRAEHDDHLLGVRPRASMRCARLVDDHERVDPDVPFGVPLGLLLAADQRRHLRPQPLHDAQLASEREPD